MAHRKASLTRIYLVEIDKPILDTLSQVFHPQTSLATLRFLDPDFEESINHNERTVIPVDNVSFQKRFNRPLSIRCRS